MVLNLLRRVWPQTFPAKPTLTSANLPPQSNRVVIITGSTAGIGLELARILYSAGATVYIAARNEQKAQATIQALTAEDPTASGKLNFLPLDLSDLTTIGPFVTQFLERESRLDLLFNNAGVALQPLTQRTAQNLEPQLGINCAAPYLLTTLLSDVLTRTAAHAPPDSVRVIWSSSMIVETLAPRGGVPAKELDNPSSNVYRNYAISKTGNWFLADRFAKKFAAAAGKDEKAVVSVTVNPANAYTGIYDDAPKLVVWMCKPIFYTALEGANSLLWAGCSSEVTVADSGRYIIPFGRWHPCPRGDLVEEMSKGDEGNAVGLEKWCERVTADFR
ncbi:hypothetical protein ASPTUDRAFT_41732 [Aspergillus tubingensis CBS 134.48]|uniref:Steroid dehydrogenase n=1 Tax=Aspergillus tubingensis (strain CBS 134.48) TaxID=767770 RepID=A0A1L9N8E0_ASPTC|nr:hypothetical protein ASPTUDRAFT_41732 [Aspergillus tubingensis CBS 134.48]